MNVIREELSQIATSSIRHDQHLAASENRRHLFNDSNHREIMAHSDADFQAHPRNFALQKVSLDAAVSPLLPKPSTPFDKTERKRAHTCALYYSECFLRGIEPVVADQGMLDAQGKYNKWWIKSTAKASKEYKARSTFKDKATVNAMTSNKSTHHVAKWRKTNDDHGDEAASIANVVSVTSSSRGDNKNNHTEDRETLPAIHEISAIPSISRLDIDNVKNSLIDDLKASGGDVETGKFLHNLDILEAYYKSKSWDGRGLCPSTPYCLDGNWLTLSKSNYNECKGRTENGESKYSLGRLSFDMFKPTNLVCSMQANFNQVRPIDPRKPDRPLHVPKKLMKELQKGDVNLRTYDIVVAITIEAGQDRKGVQRQPEEDSYVVPRPIRGILTNQGYAVPDPDVPNRLSIWFSGGSLEVQDEPNDLEEWKRIFDATCAPARDLREYANTLAAKLILGALLPDDMTEDGTMSFALKRPIGGHGSAYCDIVYMDDTLRIMRGHHGSIYVCTRVPEPEHVYMD